MPLVDPAYTGATDSVSQDDFKTSEEKLTAGFKK